MTRNIPVCQKFVIVTGSSTEQRQEGTTHTNHQRVVKLLLPGNHRCPCEGPNKACSLFTAGIPRHTHINRKEDVCCVRSCISGKVVRIRKAGVNSEVRYLEWAQAENNKCSASQLTKEGLVTVLTWYIFRQEYF